MYLTRMIGGLLPLAFGGILLVGCSKSGKSVSDFMPSTDNGRNALEAALNYWKAGNPPGTVPGTTPPVEVVDAKWKAAPKQLKEFEITGEDAPPADSTSRYFKVRLTMKSGTKQDVRYVVVGIDPLWVYGEKDFEALSGGMK